MKEDRCECHWSGVVCPIKPEKKGLTKIFSLQNSCAVRVKISGKLKLVLKIL